MMDNLLVDLDKVLDDFEAEENLVPGNETKPSGFQEYLEQANKQTWNTIEDRALINDYSNHIYSEGDVQDITDNDLSSVQYDYPYEPETFDLSEADFAPSSNVGDSGYNGSLSFTQSKEVKVDLNVNSLKPVPNDQIFHSNHMNGTISDTDTNNWEYNNQKLTGFQKSVSQSGGFVTQTVGTQSQAFLTQSVSQYAQKNFTETQSESIRVPVQADISPGHFEPAKMTFLTNGHSGGDMDTNDEIEQSEKPVYQSQLSSIPSLDSINSNPEYNKYPVQCNTPQTPKDNLLLNPLAAQISFCKPNNDESHSISSQYSHRANEQTMQDNEKLQNLKKELKFNENIGASKVGPGGNFTQSLPAYFHNQTVLQNGFSASNSLPPELENESQSDENIRVNAKEVKKGVATVSEQTSWDKYVSEALKLGTGKTTQTLQTHQENDDVNSSKAHLHQNDQSKPVEKNSMMAKVEPKNVVGFRNVGDDSDDSDLDAYLGDVKDNIHNSDSSCETHSTALQKSKYDTNRSNFSYDVRENAACRGEKVLNTNVPILTKIENKEQKVEPKVSNIGVKDTYENTSLHHNEIKTKQMNIAAPVVADKNVNQMENLDLEVLKLLPTDASQMTAVSKPVITDLGTNLSPVANISLDSGCASMTDNVDENTAAVSEHVGKVVDAGARPKDINNKVNRPSSLSGLSKVTLNSESPFVIKPVISASEMAGNVTEEVSVAERMVVESAVSHTTEARQLMENRTKVGKNDRGSFEASSVTNENEGELDDTVVELRRSDRLPPSEGPVTGRPRSWSPSDSGQPPVQKQKRPTSLNLPPPPTISPAADHEGNYEMPEEDQSPLTGTDMGDTTCQNPEGAAAAGQDNTLGAEGGEDMPYIPPDTTTFDQDPPPSYSSMLGNVAPKWIPDAEAPICMSCEARFTFTKRRHHCRACGKVYCSTCCSMKNRLPYLKNQEARVCVLCHSELALAERDAGRHPHPNNPSDYCSVVPPSQAAANTAPHPPPSVLVPVLKRDGSNRHSAPKQVMFSDGIRPGGDLTELDGSSEISRVPPRRTRVQKRVERVVQGQHSPRSRRLRTVAERTTKCLIPDAGLPPLLLPQNEAQGNVMQPNPNPGDFMPLVKDETKAPVIFAVNTNLYVSVKVVTLDCCVNRTVWCFTTKGMTSVGQEEIVIVLESQPDENSPPRDMFVHLNNVYEEASRGNVITELGHSIFNQSFLDSRDHGGFLYIRATFQCTQKLTLPSPPYLFGILLQKWETPWAKVFPLRLLLRLGAEYRYYPCPLIGIRNRKPVFFEIGHTIMNLLADFRNYQYMLPNIRGITIHMEDKVTKINFPRNKYEELMKVVNNSNEHVMAIAATFSAEADSHLVCIQNDDGNYQTQAINIQNKPRKVTGASFVVFNGALKTSSGLSAKSSIVEDGLMVQITPDSMLALKQAIRDMQDYPITCGVIGSPRPDETVVVQWVEDDKNVNIGVKSPVDGMPMDGVESLRIHHATDYVGERNIMRWTEIFFIKNEERGSPKWDPVDLSRIGETVATACCMALTQHLEKLKEAELEKIGLRVTLGNESVGYEAGAKGERLPDVYMNDLDNELIPVIHRATQPDTNIILELIFEVLE